MCCLEHVEKLEHEGDDFGDTQLSATSLPARIERLAIQELHHEKERAVLGRVVVQNANRAWMSDRVCRVTLPQEPLPQATVESQFAVERIFTATRFALRRWVAA